MGYYVNINQADFTIPARNLDAAYKAACDLNQRNDLKYGGASPLRPENVNNPNPHDQIWFSWMPWNYPEVDKDLDAILEDLGFETEFSDEGDLTILWYDSKTGAEDHFLEALAPFVEPGSYIEWRGEDGSTWRQDFDGKTMTTRQGRVIYE